MSDKQEIICDYSACYSMVFEVLGALSGFYGHVQRSAYYTLVAVISDNGGQGSSYDIVC